jgi:hypothetical protein
MMYGELYYGTKILLMCFLTRVIIFYFAYTIYLPNYRLGYSCYAILIEIGIHVVLPKYKFGLWSCLVPPQKFTPYPIECLDTCMEY